MQQECSAVASVGEGGNWQYLEGDVSGVRRYELLAPERLQNSTFSSSSNASQASFANSLLSNHSVFAEGNLFTSDVYCVKGVATVPAASSVVFEMLMGLDDAAIKLWDSLFFDAQVDANPPPSVGQGSQALTICVASTPAGGPAVVLNYLRSWKQQRDGTVVLCLKRLDARASTLSLPMRGYVIAPLDADLSLVSTITAADRSIHWAETDASSIKAEIVESVTSIARLRSLLSLRENAASRQHEVPAAAPNSSIMLSPPAQPHVASSLASGPSSPFARAAQAKLPILLFSRPQPLTQSLQVPLSTDSTPSKGRADMRDVLSCLTSAGSSAALLLPHGSSRFSPAFAASYNAAADAALSASKMAALMHVQRIDEELSEVQGRVSPTSDSMSSCSGFATPMSTLQDDAGADAESVSSAAVAVSPSPIHSRSDEGELSTPLPQASVSMGSAICFDTPALPSGAIFAQTHVPQWRAGGPIMHRSSGGSLQLNFDGDHVVPDALSKALSTAFPQLVQATMNDAIMVETGDAGENWAITGNDNGVIMCRGEGFGSPKPVMKVCLTLYTALYRASTYTRITGSCHIPVHAVGNQRSSARHGRQANVGPNVHSGESAVHVD
jgi:hypothetical protein